MELKIKRTNSANKDFIELVKELDAYLAITDGDDHDFYDQYNKLDTIKYVIVVYKDQEALGCGAIKRFDDNAIEIKRVYTKPERRGKGIAKKIMQELEAWAKELNFERCILETGERQVEAVRFYDKIGYKRMENYGQYVGVENSLCFEKYLNEL
ncbi:GNAT family N-acetyltransferase [Flavobacteriaceae bacterium S356]|uniref:GNAT family N-acetyltransferase n=1 Tax=Asprobacillus argus TaxID=3076534 RepID=A0ABU3LDG6_9FLAO|nr:GNAT family N-acetyltransferase [Flavobacteriaceae bacterium S356]